MPSRYDVSSEDLDVLHNKQGITDPKRLSNLEVILLQDAYAYFFEVSKKSTVTFNGDLLIEIHRKFLDALYPWAGKLRIVEISKNGILFAASQFITTLLKDFDQQLKKNLPTSQDPKIEIAKKLAFIHNELIAIHPFREGNGRTIRLFIDLIADHCGSLPITYPKSRKSYIDACRAGMRGDNKPMKKIMFKGLKKKA